LYPNSTIRFRTVLVFLLLLLLVYLAVEGFSKADRVNDFVVYYRAAEAVRDGFSAYDSEISGRPTLPYVYPPVLSSLLLPLAYLPQAVASAIWTVANLAALLGCLLVVRRLLSFHPDPVPIVILSLFLVFPFYRSLFRSGQIDLILFLFMLLPFCPMRGSRLWKSDLPLATAIAIKMYPAGAMLHWFVERNWKRIGSVAAVTVVVSLLVPSIFLGPSAAIREIGVFWTELTPQLAGMKDAPDWYGYRTHHSQSLFSALYRWTSPDAVASMRPGTPPVQLVSLGPAAFWVLIFLSVAGWTGLACFGLWKLEQRGREFPEKRLLQSGLVMGLIPILGPVTLKPSFITLLPVVAALLAVPGRTARVQKVSWILAAAGITLFLFPFRALFGLQVAHWLEGHSDILIGNMLLFLALWVRVIRSRPVRGRPR
jgi:hypothetical protein